MKTKFKLKYKPSFKLTKWDGEPTPEQQLMEHPENDPQCVEVREWVLGQPNVITYKRNGE